MLDVNEKLKKFAEGYRTTPSSQERRDLEKLSEAIVQDIENGKLPTPEALAAFHGFEVAADNPLNYPNYYDALKVVRVLSQAVGANPKLINDYNLMLHAAYFQDVDLVKRLLDVEGVEINKAVRGSKIRGESPLTVSGGMIDAESSRQIFDLLADRVSTDEKTNQGNWVSWAISGKNIEDVARVNERLAMLSNRFEINAEDALKVAVPLLGMNKGSPREIEIIREYFERVFESMSDIKDHEVFFRTNLGGLLMQTFAEDEAKIQPHRLEIVAKIALLSDRKLSDEIDANMRGDSKFAEKLLAIHDAVLEMSAKDRAALREMIKHPSEHEFGNLVDIVFNKEKLADFCGKLAEDKALYALFKARADAIPCLKPFVDVIDEEVKSRVALIDAEVKSKSDQLLKRMSFALSKAYTVFSQAPIPATPQETESTLFAALGYDQVAVKDFESLSSLEDDMKSVLKACEKHVDIQEFMPTGVMPVLSADKERLMKDVLGKVYDTWYQDAVKELSLTDENELIEVFTNKYIKLKEKLSEASVEDVVEMAGNLERTIGSHVKRERGRMRGSDAMSISGESTDSLSSSSGSRNNSPRNRGM